ncbi:MAG: DNA polymerase III subunit chi [Pantoea sp. Brub]|nr:DNA polymerase III subunit chi [Pantoea sp. Brub]
MNKVTFYTICPNNIQTELHSTEMFICKLANQYYCSGKRILILCDNIKQAIRLDTALWQLPINSFTPHNFGGEGPNCGAPVEIIWNQNQIITPPRNILINLLMYLTDFITSFTEVIDFIPHEEQFKQLARNRYKQYRDSGFKLIII